MVHTASEEFLSDPDVIPLSKFWQRVAGVVWPAFLMAAVLEMFVFAFVDPQDLHWLGGTPVEIARSGVYTIAFVVFWVVISLAGGITQLLMLDSDQLNLS